MKTGKMMKYLKKTDRILLEMHTGMLVFGIVCQIAGAFFAKDQARYASTDNLWSILFTTGYLTQSSAQTGDLTELVIPNIVPYFKEE